MSQYGVVRLRYSATTRQQRAATRPAIRPGARVTRCAVCVVGVGLRYSFCIVTEGGSRHDSVLTQHGQARPRYGAGARHDTA